MDGMTSLRQAAVDRQSPTQTEISHTAQRPARHVPTMTTPEYCLGCGSSVLWALCTERRRS